MHRRLRANEGLGALLVALACAPPPEPTPTERSAPARGRSERGGSVRTGGIELAAFARVLEQAAVEADRERLEEVFVHDDVLAGCRITRGNEEAPAEARADFLARGRRRVESLPPRVPGKVIAVEHEPHDRMRLMGGRIGGPDCGVEARGHVTVIVRPDGPPPDIVEHYFQTVLVSGRWWIVGYEPTQRDCSPLGTPEAFGCRALAGAEGQGGVAPG